MPGKDEVTTMLKIIPITIKTRPRYKQFFALHGSLLRKTKNAITPPIIPSNTGNKNQALLLGSVYAMLFLIILQLLIFSVFV